MTLGIEKENVYIIEHQLKTKHLSDFDKFEYGSNFFLNVAVISKNSTIMQPTSRINLDTTANNRFKIWLDSHQGKSTNILDAKYSVLIYKQWAITKLYLSTW